MRKNLLVLACSLSLAGLLAGGVASDGSSTVLAQEPLFGDTNLDELRKALVGARNPEDRNAAYEELLKWTANSEEAELLLVESLERRWEEAAKYILAQGLPKRFKKLLNHRAELDEARKNALDWIEDSERYFYPYRAPEVSSEKASTYHKVQAEVDKRVNALRKVWSRKTKVTVSKTLSAGIEEFQWLRAKQPKARRKMPLPEGIPEWVQWLPSDAKYITLRNLPTSKTESIRLERDRKVEAYNERIWSECQRPKKVRSAEDKLATSQFPSETERTQVRVTNEYRLMMGRGVLTWDPRLQDAAHGHSDYQSRTGEFGHYQKVEATKTPFQRMRLAGYTRGKSENCHKGSGDPKGAHQGWCRSSGHHRNLIAPGHMQMASAVSGDVWTQNFGIDDSAEKDL